jgi:hypothetical protein
VTFVGQILDCWLSLQFIVCNIRCMAFGFINNQTNALIVSVFYFSAAPTCFDTCVLSSGSPSLPSELHVNRRQWLIRLCVIRCYVSVMWRAGVHRSVHTGTR